MSRNKYFKKVKVTVFSKDFSVTKEVREDRVERFRQDMLCKHDKPLRGYPHIVKVSEI